MNLLADKHLARLMSNPWFAALAQEIRDDVIAQGRSRQLSEGQCVYRRGEEPDGIYAVLDGSVRVSGTSRDGREAILNIYEPGYWLGEISTLGGGSRAHDAYANTHALLLHVSTERVEALLARHPALCREMLRLACIHLRQMTDAFEAFSTQSLEQRFAARLVALTESFGTGTPQGIRIELRLSQETLAQLVGATRQRVNQLLKAWEAAGLIEQRYGRILILDPDSLRGIALAR